jgi:hypothetical protein
MKLILARIDRCMGRVVNWKLRSEMTNVNGGDNDESAVLISVSSFYGRLDFVAIGMSTIPAM